MGKQTSAKIEKPSHNPRWDIWSYRIGCPVWGCRNWTDSIYPNGTPADDFLRWYSSSFPTVEGNSTFYAVPPIATFQKWRDSSAESFQFCFKFPRTISHYAKLKNCNDELHEWLNRLAVLHDAGKLGPTFLQLAPSFSFSYFTQLEKFLRQLPRDWPWAVEVRHQDWFDMGDQESQLDELLQELAIDKVLFDSRPLNSMEASDQTETESQSRKPKTPFRTSITGKRPMLRLIGRNNAEEVFAYWEWWADQIATWIEAGHQPWIFTHAPDDTFAPGIARILHDLIRIKRPELPALPDFRSFNQNNNGEGLKQLDLFSFD
jgi:uncharacterized protein YecE (DUF72 family)